MNKIREARKAAGLSQRRMAEVMGIPQRTIENWEAGVNDPPEYVERLVVQELERIKNKEGKEAPIKRRRKDDKRLRSKEIADHSKPQRRRI